MITTGSKFFYALAALLAVAAVVYGYSTGGGEVGPLSVGYKGAVGDIVGYTILVTGTAASLFLGFASTAFRDADPEAAAELLGLPPTSEAVPDRVTPPVASYWPVVGAFGLGLALIGVVLNNVFFVAGLIVLGAVAIEWTIQAWSERATGDPAVNREIRNRLMFPIEVPVAGALAIGIVVIGFSRVFLTASRDGAVWVAIALAGVIFLGGTILSTRDRLRSDLVAGILALAAVATIALGTFAAVRGERTFEHHEPQGSELDQGTSSEGGSSGAATSGEATSGEEGAIVFQENN